MTLFAALALSTSVTVALLIEVHRRGNRVAEWVLKPLASTGFLAAAVANGAHRTGFGKWLLAGLICAWWGDVLLLSRAKRTFLAGLVAFLLGHVAYGVAFVERGVGWPSVGVGLALMAGPAYLAGRWILPGVSSPMHAPVLAYMAVITVMVALAAGTVSAHGGGWIGVGAVAFYLSDLSVARDRFLAPGWTNKLWGWPLYYGAQLVLAWCAG